MLSTSASSTISLFGTYFDYRLDYKDKNEMIIASIRSTLTSTLNGYLSEIVSII